MTHSIDTLEYWVEDFKPSSDELEDLYAHVLEAGRPMDLEELAAHLIRLRVGGLMQAQAKARRADGQVYNPSDRFEVGQKLVFPALDGLVGTVKKIRPGNNPAYGDYEVAEVKTKAGTRSMAAALAVAHTLAAPRVDAEPDAVADRHAAIVAPSLATILASDSDWVHLGDSWTLKGLLPEVTAGHLNLAEAVIMLADQPLSTADLLPELELGGDTAPEVVELALALSLGSNRRFRNVGALDTPLWTLAARLNG